MGQNNEFFGTDDVSGNGNDVGEKRDCQSPVPATRLAFDPSGLRSLRSRQAHNLSLRTSCMSRIMPHPRPQGVEYPTHTNTKIKEPL
jgi:hypothetical protein